MQATLTNQGACGEGLSPCGTGEFCNFDKGDAGQCQFCDTVSDGCQSQSIRGKEACQLRCNKMPPSKGEGLPTLCRAGLAPCGDGEFCNFNAKDEGICQRCNGGDCSSFVVTSTKGREACEIRCSAKTTQGTTRRRRRRQKKKLDTSTVLSTKDLIKGSLSSKGDQCGGSRQPCGDGLFCDFVLGNIGKCQSCAHGEGVSHCDPTSLSLSMRGVKVCKARCPMIAPSVSELNTAGSLSRSDAHRSYTSIMLDSTDGTLTRDALVSAQNLNEQMDARTRARRPKSSETTMLIAAGAMGCAAAIVAVAAVLSTLRKQEVPDPNQNQISSNYNTNSNGDVQQSIL